METYTEGMEAIEKPRRKKKRKFERRSKEYVRPRRGSERIDRILLLLHEYRLLTTAQIAEILSHEGYSKQTTGRLLSDLHDAGLCSGPQF